MKKISITAVLIIGFIAVSFSFDQKDFKESYQRGKAVYKKKCITAPAGWRWCTRIFHR
jgi:hypothetical protein